MLKFMPKYFPYNFFHVVKRLSYTEKCCKFLKATTLGFQLVEMNEVSQISKGLGIFIPAEVL